MNFSKGAAWVGGKIIPIDQASIGVTDWGLTHSDITYDVVPVREGGFFRLSDYLGRFEESMQALRLDPGVTTQGIREALHQIVSASGLRDSYCAMVASRGVPIVPGSRDPRDCANHFFAWCVPFVHVIPEAIAAKGARLKIASTKRIPADSVNPRAKNYHWGDFTTGLFEAKDAGFDSTVLLNHQDEMTEGPGFNIFAVIDGKVVTPDLVCLEGITRRSALEIATELELPTEIRALARDEFLQADEVFLTTSGGGVVPVVSIDDRLFSNGAPGTVTIRIRDRYRVWMTRPELREEIAYASEPA